MYNGTGGTLAGTGAVVTIGGQTFGMSVLTSVGIVAIIVGVTILVLVRRMKRGNDSE